ncbi:FMN-linked oxidoreductase [Choiromyces venosus 120613-1]|uniref:FMN-linked oxidoreductase n=1 Tax=Choiromyces venosus 120613-1 TaxID=1336337 RepID=A0A3N4JE05_9PEZI|nr:FMN-linked oxidoreductase [Choiromyces venosus 120613-1]
MTISQPSTTNGSKANSKLFSPLKLGKMDLKHRIIMAPLTRTRSPEHIPDENVVEYYKQRASGGGLIITEATNISVMAGNYHDVPGIFTPEQIRAWKKVTDAVHAKGGFIYCQLWHTGRTTHPINLGGRTPLGPSATKLEGSMVHFTREGPKATVTPKEMTIEEIQDTISDYVHASKCAIAAGFDGVEIHAANGYLLNQFICDNINLRTDTYGGSTENRGRIVLEVVDEVAAAIGANRVGIRFSPFSFFQGTDTSDIHEHYGYVIEKVGQKGLAYVHLIEPRSELTMDVEEKEKRLIAIAKSKGVLDEDVEEYLTLKPFKKLLHGTPMLAAGGFDATNSKATVENGDAEGIVFGRYFISNPDIVDRLRNGWPLAHYDRNTFYRPGPAGYTDYPTYEQGTANKLASFRI